jgi:EAL domain-containing protein (putative c-di-GMP-specific phosphodiesterase class I)
MVLFRIGPIMAKSPKHCEGCRQERELFPFTMAFQPIVDIVSQRIESHEALVRGPNGEGAASVLAQVNADNVFAFDKACRVRAIELAAALGLDRHLSINFLPNAIYEPAACIRSTLDAAARTGFPLDRLIFEIIEHESIAETAHLTAIVTEYRRHGFKIALDDFGTAYSGLLRLAQIKPDMIKLDRALVADCDRDQARQAILGHMASLCRELGIKVVAEGIERREEAEVLRAMGARFMQGYYFAKPKFEALASDEDVRQPIRLVRARKSTAPAFTPTM